MARKQTYAIYSVIITRYADHGMRERFEQSTPLVVDYLNMTAELIYLGSSEARARTAFYRAARRAQHDELVYSVTVWKNSEVLIRVKPG